MSDSLLSNAKGAADWIEAVRAALAAYDATRELRAAEREILDFTITGISKGEASLVKAIALVTAARKKAEVQK